MYESHIPDVGRQHLKLPYFTLWYEGKVIPFRFAKMNDEKVNFNIKKNIATCIDIHFSIRPTNIHWKL